MAETAKDLIKRNKENSEQNRKTEEEDVAALKARLLAVETTVENLVKVVNNQLDVKLEAATTPNDSNPPSAAAGPSDDTP